MNSTSPPRPHGVVAGRGINVRLAGQWDTTLERGTVPPKVGRLAGMIIRHHTMSHSDTMISHDIRSHHMTSDHITGHHTTQDGWRSRPPSDAGLSHHAVELRLLRILLADVGYACLRVVGHEPRVIIGDRATCFTLVGFGWRSLHERGDGRGV